MDAYVKDNTVKVPRDLVLVHCKSAKKVLMDELESGTRNHANLRALLENYIAYQVAADVLAGYQAVEPVRA